MPMKKLLLFLFLVNCDVADLTTDNYLCSAEDRELKIAHRNVSSAIGEYTSACGKFYSLTPAIKCDILPEYKNLQDALNKQNDAVIEAIKCVGRHSK